MSSTPRDSGAVGARRPSTSRQRTLGALAAVRASFSGTAGRGSAAFLPVPAAALAQKLRRDLRRDLYLAGKVDVNDLLEFVFPPALQHPLSTGRLYAFGMYGPLDEDARLRSGHKGAHPIGGWELDTMCLQFEREDILQVYISEGRPFCVLCEAEKEELIAQADAHLRTARGRGYRRQITRNEVTALLVGLPRDEDGYLSFHDIQHVIVDYRQQQIARFKVIFPNLVKQRAPHSGVGGSSSCGGGSTSGSAKSPPLGRSHSVGALGSGNGDTRGDGAAHQGGQRQKPRRRNNAPRGGGRRGGSSRVSAGVAPPEMFVKDAGMTNAEAAAHLSGGSSMGFQFFCKKINHE